MISKVLRGCLSQFGTTSYRSFHGSSCVSSFWDSLYDVDEEKIEEEGIRSRGVDIPEEFSDEFPAHVDIFPIYYPSNLFNSGVLHINGENKTEENLIERIKRAYKQNDYIGLFYCEDDFNTDGVVTKVSDLSQVGVLAYVDDVSKIFSETYTFSLQPVGHAIKITDQSFIRFQDSPVMIEPYPSYVEPGEMETLKAYSMELQEILTDIFEDIDAFMSYQNALMDELEGLNDTYLLYHERLIDYAMKSVVGPYQHDRLKEQIILEEDNVLSRMSLVVEATKQELETMKIRREIQSELDDKFSSEQRRYYLNEQYKLIGEELGYSTNEKDVLWQKFEDMLEGKKIPHEVNNVITEEMRKLMSLDTQSAEFNVSRSYVEWLCCLPWGVIRDENFDLSLAEAELDAHHYGLSDVKERILEFIAVSIIQHRNIERKKVLKNFVKVEEKLVEDQELLDFEIKNIMDELDEVYEEEEEDDENIEFYVGIEEEDEIEDVEETTQGKILCFVGPPGCGKTSIGHSIAEATSRDFYRFSVGGMNDVSEIKGHRRTYIGAMPGKLIQVLKRAQSQNPVVLIDEIDKIGQAGFRGDPASALLEVLDPEQNKNFMDHYLDVPMDLSKVLFICTANNVETIPRPLLDRMEVLRLSGYVTEEKVEIAKRHLIPRLMEEIGFSDIFFENLEEEDQEDQKKDKDEGIFFSDEVLRSLITGYCREAGVRNVEKKLERVLRKIAYLHVKEGKRLFRIETKDQLTEYLGNPRFSENQDSYYGEKIPVGTTIGLAWTELGGTTLYFETLVEDLTIEEGDEKEIDDVNHNRTRQIGDLVVTGRLGETMQESVTIAYTYARNFLLEKFGSTFFDGKKVHLHVPQGATPKDGPSAGITIVTSLLSLALGVKGNHKIGMTGEITLKGKVLPIGGVKEKIIAAKREGLEKIILPEENKKDLEEIDDFITCDLEFFFVDYYDDVFDVVFEELV